MRKEKPKKIIYYTDELNDDFAKMDIRLKEVDENFPFVRKNPIWRFFAWILYYCIAMPLIWFYERVILRVKFVNKKAVKKVKGQSCFFYGNHTGFVDAFTPNLLSFPKKNKIVVSPDTVSIKCIKNITQMLGAVPVPTKSSGMKKFLRAIDHYHKKCNITVYPEAHIWPYYTGVRPYKNTSFRYPVKYGAPTIAFFTAYTKPKGFLSWFRKANVCVCVSDPIFPDEGLSDKEAQQNLRDKVYAFMLEASAHSDYEVIQYVKKEPVE